MHLRSGNTIDATRPFLRRARKRNMTRAPRIPTNATGTDPGSINTTGESLGSPNPSAVLPSSGIRSEFSSIPSDASCTAPIYSLDDILKSFPLFKFLPMEIQLMIWQEASDLNPRNVPVEISPQMGPGGFIFESHSPIPQGFFACKNYFAAAKKRYVVLENRLKANDMSLVQHLPPNFWFNPAIDRFCPVCHWSPQQFDVGLELFFDVLQVSKIAISDDCTEHFSYNQKTWQTIFHQESIMKWNPYVRDVIYYITNSRIEADIELTFEDDSSYFLTSPQYFKHWRQIHNAIKALKKIPLVYDNQRNENEAAKSEGRPRVKMVDVPQWLFDVENNWSIPEFKVMVETRTRGPASILQIEWTESAMT